MVTRLDAGLVAHLVSGLIGWSTVTRFQLMYPESYRGVKYKAHNILWIKSLIPSPLHRLCGIWPEHSCM